MWSGARLPATDLQFSLDFIPEHILGTVQWGNENQTFDFVLIRESKTMKSIQNKKPYHTLAPPPSAQCPRASPVGLPGTSSRLIGQVGSQDEWSAIQRAFQNRHRDMCNGDLIKALRFNLSNQDQQNVETRGGFPCPHASAVLTPVHLRGNF